jgi:hypothetical protein
VCVCGVVNKFSEHLNSSHVDVDKKYSVRKKLGFYLHKISCFEIHSLGDAAHDICVHDANGTEIIKES